MTVTSGEGLSLGKIIKCPTRGVKMWKSENRDYWVRQPGNNFAKGFR